MKKNAKSGGDELAAMKKGSPPNSASPTGGAGVQGQRFSLSMGSRTTTHKSDDPGKIFKLIDENVIGRNAVFLGPYGRRKGKWNCITIADWVKPN